MHFLVFAMVAFLASPSFVFACSCLNDSAASLTRSAEDIRGAISGNDAITGTPVSVGLTASKFTVVVFVSAKCPCSASHEGALQKMAAEFSKRGVQFVGVHSNIDESSDLTKSHFSSARFPFSVIQDRQNYLADLFGALKTPHAYVIAQNGHIIYSGGVDDSNNHAHATRHYLREVLTALADGKTSPFSTTRTLGCAIKR